MQLSKIKIAGFKSFVDPTTINLPSKLVAVVGPNGCGKSNIIDAVTWVMGESSPKYLRGESLTDVIFNGSSSRKPIGQASVELVFDNTDGTIGGEYAKFAEISVKRVINRESDSTYMLNGVRCRKRDIVDIFLGTGLGPRSYSIIGQNMISRVVEAKPDELRTYLEEAAGISKYKERRHETELRINHTKENLSRVNDLRAELEKQLNNLRNQANVAEKFKILKEQERIVKAQLYAIQWRQLDSRMVDHTLQIQREETALESRHSELTGVDRDMELMRHEQRTAQDAFQEVQRRYYAVGNEITRIEQDVLHHQERQQQWENDLKQSGADWQALHNQMEESEENLRDLDYEIQRHEPELASAKSHSQKVENELRDADIAVQELQSRWDEFNQQAAKTGQTVNVEKARIEHLEQRIEFLTKRRDQLQIDKGKVNFHDINREIEDASKKSFEAADKLELQGRQLADIRQEIGTLQSSLKESNSTLDQLRGELQKLLGQQASLEALQQTALGQRDNPSASWASRHDLSSKPRLAQNIEVDSGWEFAVEKVLGFCLQAICVDKLSDVLPHIEDLKSGNLCVFNADNSENPASSARKGELLLSKIKSRWPVDSLVSGIYVAENMEQALKLCESLGADESVVTRDGVWMNRSWLKILREDDPAAGVFQREQELKDLSVRITKLQETRDDMESNINHRSEKLRTLEQQRDQLQQAYNQQQGQSAQITAQHKMMQERVTELKAQSERLDRDLDECTVQLNEANLEHSKSRTVWRDASAEQETHEKSRETLLAERDNARLHLQSTREKQNAAKESVHELEIKLQTAKSQKGSLQHSISRMQEQLATLNERKITLQSELSSMPPLETIKKSLSRALDKHVNIEVELNTARASMEALDQEFHNLEEKRQIVERDINKIRSILESLRLESQGWKVKADTIREQIKETEYVLEDVLKDLPQDAEADQWQANLEQIVKRINRLGPINLMAIDEFATCQERKTYLDKQVEDLMSGLATLEDAISKIDKETKQKFKETFDLVNQRFQELFPTVFGGGKAYLELNGEDLLEAGVTMMACPPGKRNSSIHLLSGGEKSLTAIALIFSIFNLNPAPFCMLDEVDAALDDANVIRYTRLVKAMKERTQFIFISHNKIAIEMGEHLIGVTMNEPGVSRLVSVDIEKAINLAGV
ncbi:MAG TPA: chromosome segregation protein SMC [Gammaproteobacteria bacterium]|jgi:chromosome segregation protein|nr:chromosome segregation protein SMC [Gammaproteobacteria bacterium]